jgi:outer membrane protein
MSARVPALSFRATVRRRRESLRAALAVFLCAFLLAAPPAFAQEAIRIDAPQGGALGWLTHPYQARTVPPVNLANSSRFDALIRAGNLYLSAQDAVALAIENNLDIEVQRYAPLLAREVLRRAQAGGALRSVGLGVAAGPQSVSLQGVSVNATSVSGGGGGVSSGGGIVTQLGPSIPNLDPTISAFANFQHTTSPQSNTFLTGTTALIQSNRSFQVAYSQNWLPGTTMQLSYFSSHIGVNSSFFALNPYTSGSLNLQVTQNLLQGFGAAVNGRNIRVQKNNLKVTDLQFKQQVITTVAAVLNLYWDLVAFRQDVAARQQELATAEQLLGDNRKQVALGALAEIEITRAQAQVFSSRQDLVVAQTNLAQQETILKNALSRNGVAGPELANVHIIPLDTIALPAQEDNTPINRLVQEAEQNRVEIQQASLNIESNKLNLVGIKNSLKPTLQAFVGASNNGLTGTPFAPNAGVEYLSGGYSNLLAQIFRRNFPNYSAGFSLNIPLRNRAAQSDYVTSQLELRQNELNLQKNENQIRVDVENAVVGVQQARVRYDAAAEARRLQQQTLDSDRRKYQLGATTPYQVMQDERDLASAQSTETQALANYTHAHIAFDQSLGRTLDVNHISLNEALAGQISRPSTLPAALPPAQPSLPPDNPPQGGQQ